MAQTTLWLMDASTNHSISVPHATRAPLQDPVWFNYLGQTAAWKRGTLDLPSKMARRIEQPNGTPAWTLSQQTYNPLGLPAISTDELGRQTRTTYFANNQDIDTESVLEGTTWQPIRSYANYSNHLPQTITQSSGLTTTIVWNAKSQPSLITQTKVSNNVSNTESFRFTYDTDGKDTPDGQPGHLMKVEATDPANSAGWVTVQSSTYDDYGRLRTRTDPTGYILTYDYDDFDRPTLITHPDGNNLPTTASTSAPKNPLMAAGPAPIIIPCASPSCKSIPSAAPPPTNGAPAETSIN